MIVNYGKTIEVPGFYDNAHLSIFSICLIFDMSSLTEIQHLEIESSEKGTHTNERMMLKMFYLCGFVKMNKMDLMGYRKQSLNLHLNKFFQSKIK